MWVRSLEEIEDVVRNVNSIFMYAIYTVYAIYMIHIHKFRYNCILKIPSSVVKLLMKLEKDYSSSVKM